MVEIQGPDGSEGSRRSLAPLRPAGQEDEPDLQSRISSLAIALDLVRRQMDVTTERTARIEGVVSALLGALDGWRSDFRDLSNRTEQRLLRGLEFLDSRIPHLETDETGQDTISGLSERLSASVESQSVALRGIEAKLEEVGKEISRQLEIASRTASQDAERLAKILDQLITGLDRLDTRLSRQVGSSEYALQGSVAEVERKISQRMEEVLATIEARYRKREETLVRLILTKGDAGAETPH